MNKPDSFVQTRQHLRFVEFVESCRANRSLGVCTGKPGVGKEASAQIYAQWHIIKPLLETPRRPHSPPARLQNCHTAYWDAEINCTLKKIRSTFNLLRNKFDVLVQDSLYWHEPDRWRQAPKTDFMELLIVNNAHRLPYLCLEALNDFRKKYNIGIALLGVPGFDRRVNYYDLVGCDVSIYHQYAKPRSEELRQILELRWQAEEITVEDAAITIIEEVTNSNIQKALNIQSEIERVRGINSISIISPEIVQAAGASLLLDVPARSKN
ncbi:MAG: AAA family ATPase [Candidatus Obscuribacterales bacterium]|nr:AAA family ATPase [Candidatus Obscuribacterales bacterium]